MGDTKQMTSKHVTKLRTTKKDCYKADNITGHYNHEDITRSCYKTDAISPGSYKAGDITAGC